ncbi:hypothetical protein HDV00_000150, partial [Rhizophlyctis rosea]
MSPVPVVEQPAVVPFSVAADLYDDTHPFVVSENNWYVKYRAECKRLEAEEWNRKMEERARIRQQEIRQEKRAAEYAKMWEEYHKRTARQSGQVPIGPKWAAELTEELKREALTPVRQWLARERRVNVLRNSYAKPVEMKGAKERHERYLQKLLREDIEREDILRNCAIDHAMWNLAERHKKEEREVCKLVGVLEAAAKRTAVKEKKHRNKREAVYLEKERAEEERELRGLVRILEDAAKRTAAKEEKHGNGREAVYLENVRQAQLERERAEEEQRNPEESSTPAAPSQHAPTTTLQVPDIHPSPQPPTTSAILSIPQTDIIPPQYQQPALSNAIGAETTNMATMPGNRRIKGCKSRVKRTIGPKVASAALVFGGITQPQQQQQQPDQTPTPIAPAAQPASPPTQQPAASKPSPASHQVPSLLPSRPDPPAPMQQPVAPPAQPPAASNPSPASNPPTLHHPSQPPTPAFLASSLQSHIQEANRRQDELNAKRAATAKKNAADKETRLEAEAEAERIAFKAAEDAAKKKAEEERENEASLPPWAFDKLQRFRSEHKGELHIVRKEDVLWIRCESCISMNIEYPEKGNDFPWFEKHLKSLDHRKKT